MRQLVLSGWTRGFAGFHKRALGAMSVASERAYLGMVALLFIVSAGGTVYRCTSMSGGMRMAGGWTMSMAWMRMPRQTWLDAAASFMGMWMVMMAAMMLPSLVPVLSGYRRTVRGLAQTRLGRLTAAVGAGYFFVWAIFGAVVYPLGVALAAAEMRSSTAARDVPIATGVTLLITGLIQFTSWKTRRLMLCRNLPACGRTPASDVRGAVRDGLRLGAHCSLCCIGLMTILLVTGVMNLYVMIVVTAAITAERLILRPRLVARAIGGTVMATGLIVLGRVFQA